PKRRPALIPPADPVRMPVADWVTIEGVQSEYPPSAAHHHRLGLSPYVASLVSNAKTKLLTVSSIAALGAVATPAKVPEAEDAWILSALVVARETSLNCANLNLTSEAGDHVVPDTSVQFVPDASYIFVGEAAKNLVVLSSFSKTAAPWHVPLKTDCPVEAAE